MSSLNFISVLRVGFERAVQFVNETDTMTQTVELPLVLRGGTSTEITVGLSFDIGSGTTAQVGIGL